MAQPPHRRLTFSGVLGATTAPFEAWSFRLCLPPLAVQVEDYEALLRSARTAWDTNLKILVTATVKLTEVKLASIGADGKYTGDPYILNDPAIAGTGGNAVMPPQIALAVSLDTPTRGARGRGRFYLPMPVAGPVATDGLITAVAAGQAATGAANFIRAINAVPGLSNVQVVSSTGIMSPVTSVRVGRALDTMRSRRRSLNESYPADVVI